MHCASRGNRPLLCCWSRLLPLARAVLAAVHTAAVLRPEQQPLPAAVRLSSQVLLLPAVHLCRPGRAHLQALQVFANGLWVWSLLLNFPADMQRMQAAGRHAQAHGSRGGTCVRLLRDAPSARVRASCAAAAAPARREHCWPPHLCPCSCCRRMQPLPAVAATLHACMPTRCPVCRSLLARRRGGEVLV